MKTLWTGVTKDDLICFPEYKYVHFPETFPNSSQKMFLKYFAARFLKHFPFSFWKLFLELFLRHFGGHIGFLGNLGVKSHQIGGALLPKFVFPNFTQWSNSTFILTLGLTEIQGKQIIYKSYMWGDKFWQTVLNRFLVMVLEHLLEMVLKHFLEMVLKHFQETVLKRFLEMVLNPFLELVLEHFQETVPEQSFL